MTTPTSQTLRRKFTDIMTRWEERVRKEISSASGTTSLSLQDALPGHLEQLAVALESANEKSITEIALTTVHGKGVGKEHGRDRANTAGYSIDEVISEYRVLRQVVIQVLEETKPLSAVERDIITDLIEQGVNDAAVQFSETVRDMREQYVATLTHDLGGPLMAASTHAHMVIRHAGQPDRCVSDAKRVIENLNRINAMIQNLLDAGRIRAGQPLSVKLTECDPAAIAKEIIDEMIPQSGERFVLASEGEVRAWWDHDLVRRALENLLNNAVKYGSPAAPVTVSIQQTDTTVTMTVHNEGNPIPESEKTELFQRYRRLGPAVASFQKGWGLGLSLVSGVVQAHGGTVTVESSPDKGTAFSMTLPKDCRDLGAGS